MRIFYFFCGIPKLSLTNTFFSGFATGVSVRLSVPASSRAWIFLTSLRLLFSCLFALTRSAFTTSLRSAFFQALIFRFAFSTIFTRRASRCCAFRDGFSFVTAVGVLTGSGDDEISDGSIGIVL
jgi:hypothetical protein